MGLISIEVEAQLLLFILEEPNSPWRIHTIHWSSLYLEEKGINQAFRHL